jgi:hypothetical protein
MPFRVEGPGTLDCHLYRQEERLILHIVNLSGADRHPGYIEEHLPVGPLDVEIVVPEGLQPTSVRSLTDSDVDHFAVRGRKIIFRVGRVCDHAVLVME